MIAIVGERHGPFAKKDLAKKHFPPIMTARYQSFRVVLSVRPAQPGDNQPPKINGEFMEDPLAEELVNIIKKDEKSNYEEAFERAFELTKSYAGSANAQASAIPFVFEKLFELFVTGKTKS